MNKILSLFAAAIVLMLTAPVHAADPVYPPGSRVGLVPLDGLKQVAHTFAFENSEAGVKVVLAELPAAAFGSIDTGLKSGQPMPPGLTRPESFDTTGGKAYFSHETAQRAGAKVEHYALIVSGETFSGYVAIEVPEKSVSAYPESDIRKMLATTTLRKDVPVDEQLSLLPFKLSELSGFKTVRTLAPGGAVLLTDAEGEGGLAAAPYIVISLAPVAPGPNDDRGMLAEQLAASIPGIRQTRITNSESVRISGSPGYETRIDAVTGKEKEETPVTVVQWLRFGGGATLRIVAGSTREAWPQAFPRFRAVRDGIEPR
jgi:hypothetical protein